MKKVYVHLITGKVLDFNIKEEDRDKFIESINHGVRGLSSEEPDTYFWINMQNVAFLIFGEIEEIKDTSNVSASEIE